MTDTTSPSASVQTPPEADSIRIGVFIDGSFWFNLAYYWLYHHSMRTQLAIEGVRDTARWYASEQFGRPVRDVVIDKAHYFQAVSGEIPHKFFNVLDRLDIACHRLPFDHRRGRAVGVKTEFALRCWDESAGLHLVMRLTGDDDYRPLVERLVEDGISVLIPANQRNLHRQSIEKGSVAGHLTAPH